MFFRNLAVAGKYKILSTLIAPLARHIAPNLAVAGKYKVPYNVNCTARKAYCAARTAYCTESGRCR